MDVDFGPALLISALVDVELRPRGPSSMLPLNSIIKDAFHKFDKDFQLQT